MKLPPTLRVIERGWLSSNVVVLHDGVSASVIDSGYEKHREQTVALVAQAAEQRLVCPCGGWARSACLETDAPTLIITQKMTTTLMFGSAAEFYPVW